MCVIYADKSSSIFGKFSEIFWRFSSSEIFWISPVFNYFLAYETHKQAEWQ